MKTVISRPKAGECFMAILFFSLFSLFLTFGISLHLDHISLLFKITSAIADSTLIAIPCMLLKGRWRYAAACVPFLLSGLLLANDLYYRNFGDLIQASSYFKASMDDPTIVSGGISSMRPYDLLYLLLPSCPLTYLLIRRKEAVASPISPSWPLGAAVLFVGSLAISYAGVFRRTSLHHQTASIGEITGMVFSNEITTWLNNYEMHNFSGYLVRCAVSLCNIGMKLSPSDIAEIKSHIASASTERPDPSTASALASGKGKNLIMIIVESLPFKVLGMDGADRLIPTLTRISEDSASFVSKCRVLADYGRSSDAQFIYNTGLLPLRNEALVDNYALSDYPSLAKALPYPSLEIIGESKRLWSHSLTTQSYGYGRLIDDVAPSGMDQDSIIFNVAEKEIERLERPFFLFVTTISMHDPYDTPTVTPASGSLPIATDDERDREFFERLRHFDRSLGRFLSALAANGTLDDSIIVILGDHEIRASKISERLHDDYVPFMIINAPAELPENTVTTQLDVFPTILDMLGCEYRYLGEDYRGLGQSLFSPAGQGGTRHEPSKEDYRISEMIIKGNPSEH